MTCRLAGNGRSGTGGPTFILLLSAFVSAFAGCSLYHAAPLPPLDHFEHGERWGGGKELSARVAEIDHPALEPVEIDLRDGMGPMEAALLAVLLNPDLAAMRATRGEAAAGLVAAGLLPNPTFGASVDEPYGSGSQGLVEVLTGSLSIDTQQIVSRSARIAAARGEVERVDLDVLWQEWQVAQQARLETVRLGWLERRIALAETQLVEESQTSDRLKEAYDEGDITADQLGVQIAAQESIRTNLVTLEQARIESRSALLALLGQPDTTELAVEAPDPEIIDALPTPMQVIPPCLARRLDLEALRRGYAAADARLWQSVLDQFPNVTVGFAAQRNESKLKFLGGFVSLGIPIFDWNQAAVARSKATRERLGLEYAARAAEVRNVVRGGLALLEMVSLRLPEIAASIEPLELIETDESSAAKSGDVDWLSYVTIRLALLDQRLQKAALSQLAAETRIGLETACGRPGWPLELAGGSD